MRIPATLCLALLAATQLCRAQEAADATAVPASTPEQPVAPATVPAPEATFEDRFPALSPDGKKIAFVSDREEPGIFHLYVADADGYNMRQLTTGDRTANWPVWSPDGASIYFDSPRATGIEISVIPAIGGEPVQVTTSEEGTDTHITLSPDGEKAAFDSNREVDGLSKLYTMKADGTNVRLLTVNPHSNSFPAWSPDGRLIAFRIRKSTFSPVSEIHVIKPDGSDMKQVTKLGVASSQPSWSHDGTRLLFVAVLDGNQEVCVASVDGSSVERITENRRNEARPSFSPDAGEIYFCANDRGLFGVYKMKADGTGEQRINFVTGARPPEIQSSQ